MAEPTGDRPAAGPDLATAVGLILALVGFIVGARIISDNSLLTHLATGDLIIDRGTVPDVDPYSRYFVGESWTVQSWLASLIYSWSVLLGGDSALRVLHGSLGWLVMAGLWRLSAPARQLMTRVVLVTVPLLIGGTFWSPRPFMFGLVGLVALLLVLRRELAPWTLLPVMWLWVNSHGSFPLALALVGAAAIGHAIDHRAVPRHQLRVGVWVLAGIGLGGLNPIGPRLWWFPIELLGRDEALERVVEWSPPTFEQPAEYIYLGLIGLVLLAAKRGLGWAELLPALGFFAGGLLAIRNIAPASVVVPAMIAPALAGLVGAELGDRRNLISRALSAASVCGLAVSSIAVFTSPGFVFDRYPVDAVTFLEGKELATSPEVVLVHREGVGNYLTYRYGSDARVFIDDRFDFYPVAQTQDHLKLLYGGDFGEILDDHEADVVLWERDSLLADWLDDAPDWSLAYADDEWIVACRQTDLADQAC
jgi:hypothetical protein